MDIRNILEVEWAGLDVCVCVYVYVHMYVYIRLLFYPLRDGFILRPKTLSLQPHWKSLLLWASTTPWTLNAACYL